MGDEWYYSRNARQHGPLAPTELKAMAAAGLLLPSDLIWRKGTGKWVPASKVKGLDLSPPAMPAPPTDESRGEADAADPVAAARRFVWRNRVAVYAALGACLAATLAVGLLADLAGATKASGAVLAAAPLWFWPGVAVFALSVQEKRKDRLRRVAAVIRRDLGLPDATGHVAQALDHFVAVMAKGGELQFEPLSLVADRVRGLHARGGAVDRAAPAVRVAGTPCKLVRYWKQHYADVAYHTLGTRTVLQGGEAGFVRLNNEKYPDDPEPVPAPADGPDAPPPTSLLGGTPADQAAEGAKKAFKTAGLLGGLSLMGLGFLLVSPVAVPLGLLSRCPECRRWWARVDDGSHEVDRFLGSQLELHRDRHYDGQYREVGHTDRTERVSVMKVRVCHRHHCKFCGHHWNTFTDETA